MNKNRMTKLIAVLMIMSLLMGCASQAAPEPVSPTPASAQPEPAAAPDKIIVSVLPFLSYAPLFIAQEEGYFADQNLDVEFVELKSSSESVTALISGQIDVMVGLVTAGLINAIRQDVSMRIVADKGYMDPNGCASTALLVRKQIVDGDDFNLSEEQRKAVVASYSQATILEYLFDQTMSPYGMNTNDVKGVDIPNNEMTAAFNTGSLDMSLTSEPWVTRILNAGDTVMFKDMEIAFPDAQYSMIVYGVNLLEKNTDAGKRFMAAYLQGVKQYQEGPTDRNNEIVNKHAGLKPEELKTLCWQSIRADGSVNTQTILDFQNWAVSKGYIESAIPVDKFWDPSFIEYAQKQIQ